jgi:hypothetical protein
MGITHFVKTKSGDSYTDRGGIEKESYITIGRMIENAKGNKIIILDAIPFAWFGGGKPVALYLQPKDDTARPAAAPAAPPPAQRSLEDEDIPF